MGSEALTARWRARWGWPVVVVLLVLLWAAVHAALAPYLVEDCFIHLRVAEHLLKSGHPYFNASEPLKASSSTPWVWLLALELALAQRHLAWFAVTASLISSAGAVCFVRLLRTVAARRLAVWEVALCAAVYLAVVQAASVTGMESPLALLFACVGLRAWWQSKAHGFAFLALAACVRPELALLFLALLVVTVASRSVPLKACLAWSFAGGGPPCLFDWIEYRTLLPHAMVAKPLIHQFSLPAVVSLLEPEALLWELNHSGLALAGYATACVVIVTAPLARLSWSRATLHDRSVQLLLVSALCGLAIPTFYVANRCLICAWYRPLYFLPLFLPALVRAAQSGSFRRYFAVLLVASPLFYDFGGTLLAAVGRPELARHFLEGARSRHTLRIASELYHDYPDATLMSSEVGAAGFGFGGPVEDAAGIASGKVLAYLPLRVPDERLDSTDFPVPHRLVEDTRPGIVLGLDRHLDGVLRRAVSSEYVHVRLNPYEASDDARRASEQLLWDNARSLDILIRRDLWQRRHPLPEGS